jgi:hypothetical protein
MNLSMLAGLFIIVMTVVLIVLFSYLDRQKKHRNLRPIPSLDNLQKSINQAVESGKGMHVSLGRANAIGAEFAGSLMSLGILKYIAHQSVNGDIPPLATSGDGLVNILGQTTLESAYTSSRLPAGYGQTGSQVAGITPYSYISGSMMALRPDEHMVVFITGYYGAEVALLADMAERHRIHTISGTNDLTAQAMLFVTTRAPLIGEEFFAVNAYTQSASIYSASVKAQDVLRVVLVVCLIGGAILKLVGAL